MIIAVPAFAVIYDLISRAVHRSLRLRKLPMETDEYRKLDHIDEKTGMFMELNKKAAGEIWKRKQADRERQYSL